jgi:hypothetical protein
MFETTGSVHVGQEDATYLSQFLTATESPGRFDTWNLTKAVRLGELVLVYLMAPVSAFVGTCLVDSEQVPHQGSDPRFRGKPWFHVRDAANLPNGNVSIRELKQRFPDWRYLLHPVVTSFPNEKTSDQQLSEFLEFLGLAEPICAEEYAIEGIKREVTILVSERNRKMRDGAFNASKGVCEACERDFYKLLNGQGMRVLQVHHRKQLSLQDVPVVTRREDLAVVCANCHLLLHPTPTKVLEVSVLNRMLTLSGG